MGRVRDKVFTVNLHHDGVFICNPIKYVHGELKQITDIDFEGMSLNDFHDVASHLVLMTIRRLYYCSIKSEVKDGIKELKTYKDVEDFLRVGYENKWFVNLYTEHHDYDVLHFLTHEGNVNGIPFESSDKYESSDEVEGIDYVDFHTEGKENVVIKNLSTQDPFLNKLCSNHGSFSGFIDEPQPVDQEPIDDPNAVSIDPLYKVKRGVSYLTNYGVANGYQLWYMRNDWRCMLVYYGRNVEASRCAGMLRLVVTSKKAKPKKKQGPPVKKGRPVKKSIQVKKSISFSPTITKRSVNSGEGCSRHEEGTSRDAEKSPQGELLTAMGRDANNQMYLIAWAVVRVENLENWGWFLALLHDDLKLKQGNGLTLISDGHKGHKCGKRTGNHPSLLPIVRRMPGRPRKERIKAPSENNSHVSRVGRVMICSNCQGIGHNKASCNKKPVPKAPIQRKPPSKTRQSVFGTHASAKGRGRGSRGGRGDRGGRNGSGRGANSGSANRGQQLMDKDDIRQNLKHDYMQDLLDSEEDKRVQEERNYQENLDEEAFKEAMEQQQMNEQVDEERERQNREEREWEENNDYFNPSNWTEDESIDVDAYYKKNSSINFNAFTQESVINDPSHPTQLTEVQVGDADVAASAQDKNKGKAIQEEAIQNLLQHQ
uniref:PB1-like domain-containing protein n=1 Tax=Tanacetum cinerariifolium TaxID=118510 RepID=A0A6L2L6I1_TANCI|nr:hypothetical protein [Tanacetum cinerariifolium]